MCLTVLSVEQHTAPYVMLSYYFVCGSLWELVKDFLNFNIWDAVIDMLTVNLTFKCKKYSLM